MGACTFNVEATGNTIYQAFGRAVEDAVWEHGHDPYSGTIATCEGPTKADWDAGPIIETYEDQRGIEITRLTEAFREYLRERLDDLGKRECEGVEISANRWMFYGWAAE